MSNNDYYDKYGGDLSPAVVRQAKKTSEEGYLGEKPWHQKENEPGQAYAAFQIYIDIGPGRSQKIVSHVLYGRQYEDKVHPYVKEWSMTYDWVNRADAWDRFISESHIQQMENAVLESEQHAIRHMVEITDLQVQIALGNEKATRTQAQMIKDYQDRFGVAKQRTQQPINVNNFNVSAPGLPEESTKNLKDVEEADFEVIEQQAEGLIPDELRSKR